MKISLFLLIALSFSSWANDKCSFKLDCKNGEEVFSLDFKSISGDCSEDDMEVSFSSKKLSKKLNLQPDWYSYTDHISRLQPSVCSGGKDSTHPFAAYQVNKTHLILFVRSSGRPGFDFVQAILLDSSKGTVEDKKTLGRTKNLFVAVLKAKHGFRTRIVRDSLSFHKEVTCDCDAPYVDDWMNVSVVNNKIVNTWERK